MKHIKDVLKAARERYAQTHEDFEEYRAALEKHAASLSPQLRGIATKLTPLSFKNSILTLSAPRTMMHQAEAHFYAEELRLFFIAHTKRDIRAVRITIGEN